MKVTIITSFPFPNGKATANRVRTFAEQLIASSNIKYVDIVCCSQENNKTYFFVSCPFSCVCGGLDMPCNFRACCLSVVCVCVSFMHFRFVFLEHPPLTMRMEFLVSRLRVKCA